MGTNMGINITVRPEDIYPELIELAGIAAPYECRICGSAVYSNVPAATAKHDLQQCLEELGLMIRACACACDAKYDARAK